MRSGHAYKLSHLNHHKLFPHKDDIEGKASEMSFLESLGEGLIFQYKIIKWALQNKNKKYKKTILFETSTILLIIIISFGLLPYTNVLFVYVILMIAGSWVIPLVTSYFVHKPLEDHELLQTKLFRGKLYSILSFEHLYHLEHHLYPMVPHKNWPKLAKRLDPYFLENKITPHVLLERNF